MLLSAGGFAPCKFQGENHCYEQGYDLLVDLLSAEPLVMLNAAFCQQHRARCPPSEQLLRECAYVSAQPLAITLPLT